MTETPRPAARPRDERVRELGLGVIMRLLALVRVGRSYEVGNRAFHQQVDAFLETLGPVLAETHEATLISLDNDLYLNGVRLPVSAANLRFHQALMEEFARRRIAGVRIVGGIAATDVEGFFRLFLQADTGQGPALLQACAAAGLHRILPVMHVSTEPEGAADPFEPVGDLAESGADSAAGAGAGSDGSGVAAAITSGPRPSARKSYSLALLGAKSLLATTALQNGVELRHAKRVVQPLIDGAFADEPVVVGLSSLSHHHEHTYTHAVNVSMVAVTMGHVLGLDRRALADLGAAALLHDVGKAAVYDRIRHPLEEFDEEDRRLAERHVLEGARLIARSTTLHASSLRCMQVALEHHAGPGGYPALPAGWRTSRLSALVSVADCYVSLLTHRSAQGAGVTPHRALALVLGAYASRFDPAALWALVRAVGFYPPGQVVELDDGRIAVVLAPNRDDLSRPHVRVVMDECGVPFSPVEAKELCPLPPTLRVARALTAEEYPATPMAA